VQTLGLMKMTMWPLTAAGFVVGFLFPAAGSSAFLVAKGASSERGSMLRSSSAQQPEAPAPEVGAPAVEELAENTEQSATDEIVNGDEDMINAYSSTSIPCSCDCCQVQKMLPASFVKKAGGETITSVCWKAEADAGTHSESETCPSMCQISADNQILTSAEGSVDYKRFCNTNCRPLADTTGSACVAFSGKSYAEASNTTETGGNGKELYPKPVFGLGSGYAQATVKASAQAAAPEAATEAAAAAPEEQAAAAAESAAPAPAAPEKPKAPPTERLKVVYDMRKLIAERLRSEAGAAVASGAAAAERVRINEWTTKQNAELLKKLRVKYAAMAGKVEEGVAGIEADKNGADEAEKKTQKGLAEGRIFASVIAKETRKLADEEIKKAVGPCAEKAANDRAAAKGLDKPEDWVKVVAARAANPYQKAVTDAVGRTAEYKNAADGLMGQAYAAQKQANSLIPHVNVLEVQGDMIGATIERKQVTNLLGRAKALQAQAKGYWNTAQSTRETIPKWQMAASQAAAYAAWEYSNNAQAFR